MPQESPHLNPIDAIHVSAILEDTVDQLIILGRVMPGKFVQIEEDEGFVVNQLPNGKSSTMIGAMGDRRDLPPISLPGVYMSDNDDKLQSDRAFIQHVLQKTARELLDSATFQCLINAIEEEKDKQKAMKEAIIRETEGRKMTKVLQQRLVEAKKSREAEVQKRVEMIAHLKDQLQEMKAKAAMESRYVEKVTDVDNAQLKKRCQMKENKLKQDIEDTKSEIDNENRVHSEIESFLQSHINKRQEQLRDWVDKYDTEVEMKQKELDLLKAAKAADYERLVELTRLYHEYEQVVVEDRIEKEKLRRKAERDQDELYCCIKIQAWWRGMMVRRCLGQYKPKKGKKGKGGKGKGKKK